MAKSMYSGKSKGVIHPENHGKVYTKDPMMEQADARIGRGSTRTSNKVKPPSSVKIPNMTMPPQPKVVDEDMAARMAKVRAARGKAKQTPRVFKPAPRTLSKTPLAPKSIKVLMPDKNKTSQIKIQVDITQKG